MAAQLRLERDLGIEALVQGRTREVAGGPLSDDREGFVAAVLRRQCRNAGTGGIIDGRIAPETLHVAVALTLLALENCRAIGNERMEAQARKTHRRIGACHGVGMMMSAPWPSRNSRKPHRR